MKCPVIDASDGAHIMDRSFICLFVSNTTNDTIQIYQNGNKVHSRKQQPEKQFDFSVLVEQMWPKWNWLTYTHCNIIGNVLWHILWPLNSYCVFVIFSGTVNQIPKAENKKKQNLKSKICTWMGIALICGYCDLLMEYSFKWTKVKKKKQILHLH